MTSIFEAAAYTKGAVGDRPSARSLMRSRLVASAVVSLAIFAAIAVDFHPSGPMYAITIGGFAAPAQAQSAAGIEARNEVVRGRMSIMNERQELHVERKRQESAESVRGRFPKAGAQRKLPLESDLPRVDDAETVEPQG